MIDLHCHVLPGIDDGPRDVAGSVALVEEAARQGVSILVATPHARDDYPLVDLNALAGMCQELRARLHGQADIQILPGAELDLLWAQSATDEQLRLASLGQYGTDLLVETPYGELPGNFEDLLFAVSVRGFRILLAHPERSPTFQAEHARLEALVDRGVLIQITAPALVADRRSRSRRYALTLIDRGLAHVLSSDAHAVERFRPVALADAAAVVARIDPDRARWMVRDTPMAILRGEPLPPLPPLRSTRWKSRLAGRLSSSRPRQR